MFYPIGIIWMFVWKSLFAKMKYVIENIWCVYMIIMVSIVDYFTQFVWNSLFAIKYDT